MREKIRIKGELSADHKQVTVTVLNITTPSYDFGDILHGVGTFSSLSDTVVFGDVRLRQTGEFCGFSPRDGRGGDHAYYHVNLWVNLPKVGGSFVGTLEEWNKLKQAVSMYNKWVDGEIKLEDIAKRSSLRRVW